MRTINAPSYVPRVYEPMLICLHCGERVRGRKALAEHVLTKHAVKQ